MIWYNYGVFIMDIMVITNVMLVCKLYQSWEVSKPLTQPDAPLSLTLMSPVALALFSN